FRLQFTDGICPGCASRVMDDDALTPPPSARTRWPGSDRAAVIFVGVPLMAALVLAAAPLSEPPALTAVAALPSRAVRLERDGALATFDGRRAVMAHVDRAGPPRVGKYGVDVEMLEAFSRSALAVRHGVALYLVDEIGKMECLSPVFVEATRGLLDADVPLV